MALQSNLGHNDPLDIFGKQPMFNWLTGRRKREKEWMMDMVRTSREGEHRAQLARALGSAGIQLPEEPDNTAFCINASAAFVRMLLRRCELDANMMDDDDRFVVAIFCFSASNFISWHVGAPFEIVASVVPLDVFGPEYAIQVPSWGSSFNEMSKSGRIVEAITKSIERWFVEPTDSNLQKIVGLYTVCRNAA